MFLWNEEVFDFYKIGTLIVFKILCNIILYEDSFLFIIVINNKVFT